MVEKLKSFFTTDRIALLVITMITATVFLISLNFEACYQDDYFYTQRNWFLSLSWTNIYHWLTHTTLGLYSPVAMFTYMFDVAIWSEENLNAGIRLQNIFWHIAACWGFYAILRKLEFKHSGDTPMVLSPFFACTATLLFAIHPQRVESVVWLSERKDVLVMALGLWATWLFIRAMKAKTQSFIAPVLIFISFGTKPMMVTIIGVWWLYLISQRDFSPISWLKKLWPIALVVVCYLIIIRYYNFGNAIDNYYYRINLAIRNYGLYFFKTYLPTNLNPLYPLYYPKYESNITGFMVLGLLPLLVLLGKICPRYRDAAWFGYLPLLLAFFGTLLPVGGLFPVGNVDFADRYSYFSSIFLWIALAFTLQWADNEFIRYRKIVRIIPLLYIVFITVLTGFHLFSWSTVYRYMNAALEPERPHRTAIIYFADIAAKNGDIEILKELLQKLKASSITPLDNSISAMFIDMSMGTCLVNIKKIPEGIAYFERVLSSPYWKSLMSIHYRMGLDMLLFVAKYHHQNGNRAQAVKTFNMLSKAVKDNDIAESLFFLGMAHFIRGDLKSAEQNFAKSAEFFSDDPQVLHNLKIVREILQKSAVTKK